jgi:hypothetical protein
MRIEYVGPHTLILADCREALTYIEDIHACVTDPPYELGFMGKKWDGTGIANDPEMWKLIHNGLLPGAHVLAFSGSRTYHRMACAIEDAAFEIRDQIMWIYGSGFPKSQNISKAIDKAAGAEREVVGSKVGRPGYSLKHSGVGGVLSGRADGSLDNAEAECSITAPATDAAKQWDGWGTALKPAHEPVCVARKSFKGTVADNVITYGTGALNIDGCRVEGTKDVPASPRRAPQNAVYSDLSNDPGTGSGWDPNVGRWPANVIHDGSDEVVEGFPDSGGSGPSRTLKRGKRGMSDAPSDLRDAGSGSAARFFYCAKASKKERGEGNNHPTVKPIALMRYLCRLVTPPDGVIVDPFMGSGSTGIAAVLEGFTFVGIEKDPAYFEIALKRVREAYETTNVEAVDVPAFVR